MSTDIRIHYDRDDQPALIARAWSQRVDAALAARFPEPDAVKWFVDAPGDIVNYFDVRQKGQLAARAHRVLVPYADGRTGRRCR